jgi:hypothetical protein
MVPQVYVAGQPVAPLAPVGDLVISHEWPAAGVGGPVSALFSLLLPSTHRPGWLAKGATAEVRYGGIPLLAGSVAEVDWSDGSVTIDGSAREGSSTSCLGADGETSSTPDPVIDTAKGRGALTWTRRASISPTPRSDGDSTAKLNSVSDMLATYADTSGARLYVDPWRRLLKGSDPTSPEVFVIPGAGELSWTTGGLSLSAGQFIGTPDLASVAERVGRGLMVRLLGQRDPRPDRLPVGYVDFVVERSEWNVADGKITLTPRGMVASDFASILAEAGVQEAS